MKQRTFSGYLVFIFMALAGWACAIPQVDEDFGTVVFRVSDRTQHALGQEMAVSRGLVHDPMPASTDLEITIEGTGPGNAVFSSVVTMGTALSGQLVAGAWNFSAQALDAGGKAMLQGSAIATVDPVSGASVSIIMRPLPGTGSLSVSYVAPPDVSGAGVWVCSLLDDEGAVTAGWEDPVGSAIRNVDILATGYYSLSISIIDNGLHVGGRTDVVRIVAGVATHVPIDLEATKSLAEFGVSIEDERPLAVSARLISRAGMRGFPMVVQASGATGASCVWSQSGMVLGTGIEAAIQTDGLPGTGKLDLTVFESGRAGAVDFEYSLVGPVSHGGWAWYADVSADEEPASAIMSQPAMVSASADGGILGIASAGTSSTVEIWSREPVSGESRPVSKALVRIAGSSRKATLLRVSRRGDFVAAANSESGWLWVAPVNLAGQLGTPLELVGGSVGLEGLGYLRDVCFSPGSDVLFVLSNADRSLYEFRLSGASWILESRTELDALPCGILSVYKCMAIDAEGTMLAIAAAGSDTVVFLGLDGGNPYWLGEAKKSLGYADLDYPQAMAFNPDGSRLAVACKDSAAVVILGTPSAGISLIGNLKALDGLPGVPLGLAYSADGKVAAISTSAGVALISVDSAGVPQDVHVFDGSASSALATPAGLAFVTGWLYVACPDSGTVSIIRKLAVH